MIKEISFNGIVTYDGDLLRNNPNKLFADSLDFFSNKPNIMVGGINEHSFSKTYSSKSKKDVLKTEYFIKGSVLTVDDTVNEEIVYYYIREFCNKYNFNIEIERVFNIKDKTEFFPVNKYPNFLYQYTSINTLKLILENKNIRFNSLSNVDDIEEKYTSDLGDYGRFCFVSCWVSEEKELVPMWHMYGDNMKGVRIRLPINPFINFDDNFDKKIDGKVLEYKNNMVCYPHEFKLYNIYYDDSSEKRNPTMIKKTKRGTTVFTDLMGRYKNKYWEFQKEWRYKIFCYPFSFEEFKELTKDENILIKALKERQLTFSDLYIKLDEKKLSEIEIVMGPKTSLEDKKEVIRLLKENCNNVNVEVCVKDSQIKIQ